MSDATRSSPISGKSATSHDEVWPVYKGTSFNLWQPDTGIYYDSAEAETMIACLQEKRFAQHRSRTSAFAEQASSLMEDSRTLPCRSARIAFRNVTRSTDTRSLITALLPPKRVIVHHAPYLLRTIGTPQDEAFLLGVLSSMLCDWQSRRTVELNMTFEQVGLLSIPDPGAGHDIRDRTTEIAGRLAACDERFAEWANEVGVPVGSVNDEETKQDLICELDACVAHLYGLDEEDLAVIYETFSSNVDYSDHHASVLDHFRRIRDAG